MVFCPPETEHLEPTNFELPWKLVSTSIRERHEQEAAAKEQAQDDESKAKLKELKARKKAMQRMQSVQVCLKNKNTLNCFWPIGCLRCFCILKGGK